MTLQNQHLTIPPDHAVAVEFYDLQCVQSTIMNEHYRASVAGDAARVREMEALLAMVDGSIRFLQTQYRCERGGDDSCRVGLTIGSNGYPVVTGRARDGSPFIHDKIPVAPVRH